MEADHERMKVLVTGGTGFIGSRMALHCHEQGDEVRVLARRRVRSDRPGIRELDAAGIAIIEGSVTDPASVEPACRGIDVVYHLAAAHNESHVPEDYFRQVNVHGTANVLAAARAAGVKRFVHASTAGVYGPGQDGVIRDTCPLSPNNAYTRSKLEAEALVREAGRELPCVILRLSETYGPADGRLLKLFKGLARGRYLHVGRGDNLHHPIYVADLVRALRLAGEHPAAPDRTWLVAGPRALTTREMVASICRALQRPEPRLRVPLAPLHLAARALETVCPPLGIRPPLHRRRLDFFVKNFQFVADDVRSVLGFTPWIDFDEGAAHTAAWYRQMNLL